MAMERKKYFKEKKREYFLAKCDDTFALTRHLLDNYSDYPSHFEQLAKAAKEAQKFNCAVLKPYVAGFLSNKNFWGQSLDLLKACFMAFILQPALISSQAQFYKVMAPKAMSVGGKQEFVNIIGRSLSCNPNVLTPIKAKPFSPTRKITFPCTGEPIYDATSVHSALAKLFSDFLDDTFQCMNYYS